MLPQQPFSLLPPPSALYLVVGGCFDCFCPAESLKLMRSGICSWPYAELIHMERLIIPLAASVACLIISVGVDEMTLHEI